MTANKRTRKFANRNEEERLRCRLTEVRTINGVSRAVQCTENRKQKHVHQHRGKAFADQTDPVPYTPVVTSLMPSLNGGR